MRRSRSDPVLIRIGALIGSAFALLYWVLTDAGPHNHNPVSYAISIPEQPRVENQAFVTVFAFGRVLYTRKSLDPNQLGSEHLVLVWIYPVFLCLLGAIVGGWLMGYTGRRLKFWRRTHLEDSTRG